MLTEHVRLGRAAAGLLFAGMLVLGASIDLFAQQPTQSEPERVELIMEGLPPAGSAAYKNLIGFAGDAKGQVLELTKCEMWSVRPRYLERLKREAAKRNVKVHVLTEDWNKVLQPMAPQSPMPERAKTMIDQAMQSPSTSGVGMMAARQANIVEYALTKGMKDKRGAASDTMKIKIAINDKTSVTAVRRDVEIKGNRCVWRGVVEGTENPVTIMWWSSGRLTGTIQHGDRIYQLKQLGQDMIGIVESMVDKMPDEHARLPAERLRELRMRSDPVHTTGDASMARPRPKREETPDSRDATDVQSPGARQAVVAPNAMKSRKRPSKATGSSHDTVVDVMVAYTTKAASHYGNIKLDLIELAIEETQESFRASGIPNVKLRLVHTHQTTYDETAAEHFDHVWRIVDRGDGFLEEIPQIRDQKKADIVILIVDDAKGCGLATRVAADADEAFAVVHHECAATTYSLAHEIGHLIGTRHDRLTDKSRTPFPFGHGFIAPSLEWRTMMSYKASCNGCPRRPIWSSPVAKSQGMPTGDEMHDNARVIREQAERVARFR